MKTKNKKNKSKLVNITRQKELKKIEQTKEKIENTSDSNNKFLNRRSIIRFK